MERIYESNAEEKIAQISRKRGAIYIIPAGAAVMRPGGGSATIDEEYCASRGIRVFDVPCAGGAIVVAKGDIEFACTSENSTTRFVKDFLNTLADHLSKRGLNAALVDNDVLIDGIYKVASGGISQIPTSALMYCGVHISMSADAELIGAICTKPAKKVPKGLSEYGFKTEELLLLLTDFEAHYEY